DRAVDADHLAVGVDQGAAGVARVDRRVGLQHAADRLATAAAALVLVATDADGAVLGADDAGGDRALQAQRTAQREDRVADPGAVAVAEPGGGQAADALHLDDREVAPGIGTDDLRPRRLAVAERHRQVAVGAVDDV